MLRSLYSGVSGLRSFQTKLDVIGDNIANVNTVGFKGSRVMFQDVLSQTVAGATGPADDRGGTNPRQIGLGTTIGSIDVLHTPGSWMTTNVPTDLAIEGEGFFVVTDGNQNYLTRAGNFYIDANRNLVTSGGLRVVGTNGNTIQLGDPDIDIESFEIGRDGTITVTLANGATLNPQIALVKLDNPAGLQKVGNSLYSPTPNADSDITDSDSILENLSTPGEDGTGQLITGVLEMSNVDLAAEFTEMIVAQRAFQANSRIITTSDEVLQELVNLKR
ncbi:flagellar basal body rod protein FlgG [Novibacillus thermophilus]|uniref:Flagellar basal-body rod protein FlgF n=1 Tax=Novibacillus thermophilus TaxID=1471761 RepID=A0A1U9KA65_9BACL|nr:flagellar basal body rod protein FlgG [Novibacillus thermophilus]AQS56883.1 flagellar basal-body rod protein FlgF [Novibacillus thermophilus]